MHTDQTGAPSAHMKVDVPPMLASSTDPTVAFDMRSAPPRTPLEVFESVYINAEDDAARVPWADGKPNPHLVSWLNREACSLVRPGARTAVVGCGLGDDVAELSRRGYDVIGFDISPTAVRWASRRHPLCADRFYAADLLSPPGRMLGRFDMVIEIETLQSLEPSLHSAAARSISRLMAPRGVAMVLCRAKVGNEAPDPHEGPPYMLSPDDLTLLMQSAGLALLGRVEEFWDHEDPPRARLRGVFTR